MPTTAAATTELSYGGPGTRLDKYDTGVRQSLHVFSAECGDVELKRLSNAVCNGGLSNGIHEVGGVTVVGHSGPHKGLFEEGQSEREETGGEKIYHVWVGDGGRAEPLPGGREVPVHLVELLLTDVLRLVETSGTAQFLCPHKRIGGRGAVFSHAVCLPVHGCVADAQGVAGTVHDVAEHLVRLLPALDEGSGDRVLCRSEGSHGRGD